MTLIATPVRIDPSSHGQAISLAEFDHAIVAEGCLAELSRGIIQVSDIPSLTHAAIVRATRKAIDQFSDQHPTLITGAFSGGECKILIEETASERHPDFAVYLSSPPQGDQPWNHWTPGIVIEVVSESSIQRDHIDKREDYWLAGIKEYWIIDPFRAVIIQLSRADKGWQEQIHRAPGTLLTPLLPGFQLSVAKILTPA